MTASRILALVLAIATAALAQNFTTTCANNTCVLTVTSGTVTIGTPPVATPTITSFTPATGPSAGGTAVTIIGTNFAGVTRVSLAGVNVTSFSVPDPQTILAVTGADTNSTGIATVITGAGTANSTATFTYVVPPPAQPISDRFPGTNLNTTLWSFINPQGDGSESLTTASQLKLVVPGGKNHDPAFGGVNNSIRIMQSVANVDFSVIVQFDSIPQLALAYQFEGLIIQQDATNYLRLQFGSTGTVLVCNMDAIAGAVETTGPSATITQTGASLWLGIKRAANVWSFYYSLDGVQYVLGGSMTRALTMSSIGPFAGNYGVTSAPAFTGVVNSFLNTPIPSGTAIVLNPGANIQAAIDAAPAGTTSICMNGGAYSVPARLALKQAVTYCNAGTVAAPAVLTGAGGYPLMGLAGNGISINGLTLEAGGIEITGSADNLSILNTTIGEILTPQGGAAGAGIYQDPVVGAVISNSKIEDSTLRNIYGPGELVCKGVFPPVGQPCDYDHNGIVIFSQKNLSIQRDRFETISGDAVHAFEAISCGETGGPRVPQPGLIVSHNTILDNHRIPIELQLCGMSAGHTDANSISGTYVPNAWDIVISLASECTGCTVSGNYIDGAKSQGPGWNIIGTPFEIGGTGTVTDGNFVTSSLAASGNAYLGHLALVMGSAAVFTNNRMCGPAFGQTPIIIFEPPCTTGASCSPWSATNNTVAASCAGFPPPPAKP